jgi:hypothetical protein
VRVDRSAHTQQEARAADVLVAVADTHLGLNEHGARGHRDQGRYLSDFLGWLARLPPEGWELPVLQAGRVRSRRLRPPGQLVLLGDVLELWDAENDAVLLSALTAASHLGELRARVVWVTGNHDVVLHSLTGRYPLPRGTLDLVGEVYPGTRPHPRALRIGTDDYVFLHGHQFDRAFRDVGALWRILSPGRQAGAALGDYAWAFFGLWLLAIAAQALQPTVLGWVVLAALFLLWLPRFYMRVALVLVRNHLSSVHKRRATLRGFAAWWRKHQADPDLPPRVHVVHGHTHYLDAPRLDAGAEGTEDERWLAEAVAAAGPKRPVLLNLPAWVSPGAGREADTTTVFLYADAHGPLFVGWDWKEQRPFHVPFELAAQRRAHRALTPEQAKLVLDLGWPPALAQKWVTTQERV